MSGNMEQRSMRGFTPARLAAWSAAALLLAVPFAAMQFTDQVAWSAFDFAAAGVLVIGAGLAYELAVRISGNAAYRLASGIAVAGAFLLAWLSLGVGIIGSDGDPANLLYFGVLGVGAIGAAVARFRASGMAGALVAMALAQAVVAAVAIFARLGYPSSGPLELALLNGFFIAVFLASAWLFRRARS